MLSSLYDGDDWPAGIPVPCPYNGPEEFPQGYWAGYAVRDEPLPSVLRSSTLILVSKQTGEIVGFYSADDEG